MSGEKPGTFLKLFLSERRRLVRLVGRIVGCRDTAEDIAQDAFLRLWGRTVGSDDISLLFRTGQNLAIDHMRARQVRTTFAEGVTAEQFTLRDAQPDDAAAARQELDGLMAVLRGLPERTQRAFLLNRLDGLSYAEIAEVLDVSVSTVEKDIIRALQASRRWRDRQVRP
jgi:RNA polymerase sigma factor (sigma-70 family)